MGLEKYVLEQMIDKKKINAISDEHILQRKRVEKLMERWVALGFFWHPVETNRTFSI